MFFLFTRSRSRPPLVPSRDPRQRIIIRPSPEDQIDLYPDDPHNVHNKTVHRSAQQALKRLIQWDLQATLQQIKQQVRLSDQALNVLDHLNQSELQVVRLIWSRINHPDNREIKDQLISLFETQLLQCLREDQTSLQCPEGQTIHLLQTLHHELPPFKTLWIIRDEMAEVIAHQRDKLPDRITETQLQDLIRSLKTKFIQDYREVLSPSEIDELTRDFFQELS